MNHFAHALFSIAAATVFAAAFGFAGGQAPATELEPQFRAPRESTRAGHPIAIGMYVGHSAFLMRASTTAAEVDFYEYADGNPFGRKIDLFATQSPQRIYDALGPAHIPQRDAVGLLSWNETDNKARLQLASLHESDGTRHVATAIDSGDFFKAPKASPGATAFLALFSASSGTHLLYEITDSLQCRPLGSPTGDTQRFQFAWIGPQSFLRIVSGSSMQTCTIKDGAIEEGANSRLGDGFYQLPEFQPLDGRKIVLNSSPDVERRSADGALQEVVVYSPEGLPSTIGSIPMDGRSSYLADKHKFISLTASGTGRTWDGNGWTDFQLKGTPPFVIGFGVGESGTCACIVAMDAAAHVWLVD